MAIPAILFGGMLGFISFLMTLFAFDFGLFAACGFYFSVGLGSATLILIVGRVPQRTHESEAHSASRA